jgi:hypothetical protein
MIIISEPLTIILSTLLLITMLVAGITITQTNLSKKQSTGKLFPKKY